jgi:integral membrane protein (TIGR01906 family)
LKIVSSIAAKLFIISVSLTLVTGTIQLEINSVRLYEYGFDKYAVSEDTGIDRQQLTEVARKLVYYFNYRIETPQLTVQRRSGEEFLLYQEDGQNRELTHLADVRRLFLLNSLILLVSLVYLAGYVLAFLLWIKGHWWDLATRVRHGCVLTLAVMVIMGLTTVLVDFEQLFFQFHHLAFSNPWWASTGYLPRLFPEYFWEDVALLGAVSMATGALFLGSVAWVIPMLYLRKKG